MTSDVLKQLSMVRTAKDTWPSAHPADSSGFIFMSRALSELAKVKYGELWTGSEPFTNVPELLPNALAPMAGYNALLQLEAEIESDEPVQWFDPPSRAVLERADDLLAINRPELNRPSRCFGLFAVAGRRPLRFTITEWKIAQSLAKAERDIHLAALTRWINLQKEVVELCERGLLQTVLRPIDGGEFSEVLPCHFWRCENYTMRFVTFSLDPRQPFGPTSDPKHAQWIFFTKASLRIAIAKLKGCQLKTPNEEGYESELLVHMRKVSQAIGMRPENPPKKIEVVEALQRMWEGEKPLSEADLNHMASFIRPLASRAGRNRNGDRTA